MCKSYIGRFQKQKRSKTPVLELFENCDFSAKNRPKSPFGSKNKFSVESIFFAQNDSFNFFGACGRFHKFQQPPTTHRRGEAELLKKSISD